MKHIFLGVAMILTVGLKAQHEDLAFYCDAMANAYEASNRYKAEQKFNSLFEAELKKSGSFENDFRDLKWVSIKQAPDKSFRIITWQIKHADGIFTYKGLIQKTDGSLITLQDHAQEMGNINFDVLNADDWFGALYYNLKECGEGMDKYYILFGYNGWNDRTHKKVIDVLHFVNGEVKFGKAIFENKDKNDGSHVNTRVVIEYDATANVNCNYNAEMKMIVYDFVSAHAGFGPTGEAKKLPDGTYVAYESKGDKWQKIDQLETKTQSNEDIFYKPKTSESGSKKDIFGKDKKSKN